MSGSDLIAFVSRCLAVVETDVVTIERWAMEPTLPFPQRAALNTARGRLVGHQGAREVALNVTNDAATKCVRTDIPPLRRSLEASLLAGEHISEALASLSATESTSEELFNRSQMLELNANVAAHLAEAALREAVS